MARAGAASLVSYTDPECNAKLRVLSLDEAVWETTAS